MSKEKKSAPKTKHNEWESTASVQNIRQQRSISKQPAQDRLKRLQKQINSTSSVTTRAALRKKSTAAALITPKDLWEKPKALIDACNGLNKRNQANKRLAALRTSLEKNNNNNNNNNSASATAAVSEECPKSSFGIGTVAVPAIATATAPAPALIPVQNTLDEEEPMDWQDDDCEVTNNLLQTESKFSKDRANLPDRCIDYMYFVLDTNVLMHDLDYVDDLIKLILPKTVGSMLYIPYVVIKELDKLKIKNSDDKKMSHISAIRAIRYLNRKFDDGFDIQAQSAVEESHHLIDVDCPDDNIVNCCLQLKDEVSHLMLLTNDANLRLKAVASSIKVSCISDLMLQYPDAFKDDDDSEQS